MGIRNKLVLCLLAVLIPLAAVGMFATLLVERQLTERTTSALANTQRLETARIEQILGGYNSDARSLASGPHVRTFLSALHAHHMKKESGEQPADEIIGGQDGFSIIDPEASWPLQQLALNLQRKAGIIGSSITELRLVSRDGLILGETLGFSWTPDDPKLVDRSMRSVKTTFGEAFINQDDMKRLGIVSPVLSSQGEVVGALIMESRLGPITDLISKHEVMGNSIEAHIAQPTLNGDALFITPLRFDRTAAFRKLVSAEMNLAVNKSLNSPQSQVIKALDYRGVESYLAFQTIAGTGWGLIIKVDAADTYAPTAKLRRWLLGATAASIGFVALIYLFFLVPIVKRLNKAALAARQIMGGNLSARLVDNKNDEISELASSINTLARDLEADQRKRGEAEARLLHHALHDELTGLLNRKHANTVIQRLSEKRHKEHSIMFLDLNGFKEVNDLYGHAAGDTVLKKIAERLTTHVPQHATLARWGGDEFVVILPDADNEMATVFATTLHKAFEAPVNSDEGRHSISCSIGLATSSNEVSLSDALIEADILMYQQKEQHKSGQSKGGKTTRHVERAQMEEQVNMWFQPVLRMQRPGNYVLVGADTQLRIRNKQGDYVMPEALKSDVQDDTVAYDLNNRTIDLALSALHRWNAAGIVNQNFQLNIKLTESTLNDAAFPFLLENQLNTMDILPTQLQLELPAKALGFDDEILNDLKELGVSLAINSVGNEPSLLRQVPAIQPAVAIVGKPCHAIALSHIMHTCNRLNVNIIARQVDTHEALTQLHELGVTCFQGELFEHPISAVDFVSRWGQARLTGLGRAMICNSELRLAV